MRLVSGLTEDWYMTTPAAPRRRAPAPIRESQPVSRVADLAQLMTVDEVASYLKVHPDYVYRVVSRGLLQSKRMGRRGIRITAQAVQEFLDGKS